MRLPIAVKPPIAPIDADDRHLSGVYAEGAAARTSKAAIYCAPHSINLNILSADFALNVC